MTTAPIPYADEALEQLATMLLHYPFEPTPDIHAYLRGETQKLDYSLASLPTLQSYLSYMRTRKLSLAKRQTVILRTGAYLGEVLRRHWPEGDLHWLEYKTANAIAGDKYPAGLEGNFDVSAVLYRPAATFVQPLAKVGHMLVRAGGPSLVEWAEQALAECQASEAPQG